MLRYSIEEIEEVRLALAVECGAQMYKRLQALLWRMKGMSEEKVATQSGFSTATISRLCRRYKAKGVSGLHFQHKGNNNRKLSKEAESKALEVMSEKAKSGSFVRVNELRAEFKKDTGVAYSKSAFYELLRRNDWRTVMPRRQHPKAADEATIEASKKLT